MTDHKRGEDIREELGIIKLSKEMSGSTPVTSSFKFDCEIL